MALVFMPAARSAMSHASVKIVDFSGSKIKTSGVTLPEGQVRQGRLFMAESARRVAAYCSVSLPEGQVRQI